MSGYAPRTAADRLRVARVLGALPKLEAALAGGRRFSAIRELTRVATRAAVEEASAHGGAGVALEVLIAEALRRCLKRAG